jgi:hypothetical protein
LGKEVFRNEKEVMAKRQSLEAWIQEAITDVDKDGKISAISCVHMVGQNQREVHTVKFADRVWQPKDLAALFMSKCESYSQDLPGQQYFCLLAFYNGRNEPEATHPFIVTTADASLQMGLLSDPPNELGQKQQGMRHIEVMAQLHVRGLSTLIEAQNQALLRADRRIAEAETNERELFVIFKQMMLEKIENDQKQKLAILQFQRDIEERKKWLSYVPGLINNLLGKEIFPQNTEDTALIEAAAEHLNEDQIKLLSGVLPAELWGPLSARLAKYMKEKRLAAEEAKQLASSIAANVKDPEAEAGGDAEGVKQLTNGGVK